MKWTLLPAIPVAIAAIVAGLAATHTGTSHQLLHRLRMPITNVIAATTGMIAADAAMRAPLLASGARHTLAACAGAALLGAATAQLITPKPVPGALRSGTVIVIAAVYAYTVSIHTLTALATGYLVTAAGWWLLTAARITHLAFIRPTLTKK